MTTASPKPLPEETTGLFTPTAFKRLGALVAVSLVAALMTGPSGDSPTPLAGVRGSIFNHRIVGFLLAAVVLWVVSLGYERLRPRITKARTSVNRTGAAMFARPGARQVVYLTLLVLAI